MASDLFQKLLQFKYKTSTVESHTSLDRLVFTFTKVLFLLTHCGFLSLLETITSMEPLLGVSSAWLELLDSSWLGFLTRLDFISSDSDGRLSVVVLNEILGSQFS